MVKSRILILVRTSHPGKPPLKVLERAGGGQQLLEEMQHMLAPKYSLELYTKLFKSSKCGVESIKGIQSICNRKPVAEEFGVLQLQLVGLQRSFFMVNFAPIGVACCICVICNWVRELPIT